MPIRRELRHLYRTPEYLAARERVLERAKNRCEQCGKRNHRRVWVYAFQTKLDGKLTGDQAWTSVKGDGAKWRDCARNGEVAVARNGERWWAKAKDWERARRIRVILTCAHLDHDPRNNADGNLKLLCQWCHLNYDKLHHKESRSIRKDRSRPLLAEAS